jgi:hypothetical protein
VAGATGGLNPWRYAEEGERDAAGNEPARPFSVSGLIRESMGPGPSSCPCTGSSTSRGPHHRHDPSPDGIGQAVPDGGQLSHLSRDLLGLSEAPHSLGFVGWCCSYAPVREGRGG